ncbi:DUF86 domain-containing protein [Candidatus Sumerlaeota bacterium]|nr:DUF86 domain-containing protein [Candidatus Sumerlaeota bacterium]
MPPDYKDMSRLWDMLDAARAAVQFAQGQRFEELLENRMLRNAVERNLEILGEAARRVSQTTRDTYSDTPGNPLAPCATFWPTNMARFSSVQNRFPGGEQFE